MGSAAVPHPRFLTIQEMADLLVELDVGGVVEDGQEVSLDGVRV